MFVSHSDPVQTERDLRGTGRQLGGKNSVMLFPRKAHAHGKRINHFGQNTIAVTSRLGVPVVPLAVGNTCRILPHRDKCVGPKVVALCVRPTVGTAAITGARSRVLLRRVEAAVTRGL